MKQITQEEMNKILERVRINRENNLKNRVPKSDAEELAEQLKECRQSDIINSRIAFRIGANYSTGR